MGKPPTKPVNSCAEESQQTQVEEDEEPFVFEGITLAHSPQLGRRFIEWLSDRRE